MGSQYSIGWTVNRWKDELSWSPGVKLAENMFLLIHCIVDPLSHLATLSSASSRCLPTPHLLHTVLLQTVLCPLTVDVFSGCSSPLVCVSKHVLLS